MITDGIGTIAQMAMYEQKRALKDPEYCLERLKAYRICLAILRPDLTSDQICDEVLRMAKADLKKNKTMKKVGII